MSPSIDIRSDLNAEDDNGENWALLDNADDPLLVRVGAVMVADTARFRSVIRITAVDPDGQVHFVQFDGNTRSASAVFATPDRRSSGLARRSAAGRRRWWVIGAPDRQVFVLPNRAPTEGAVLCYDGIAAMSVMYGHDEEPGSVPPLSWQVEAKVAEKRAC